MKRKQQGKYIVCLMLLIIGSSLLFKDKSTTLIPTEMLVNENNATNLNMKSHTRNTSSLLLSSHISGRDEYDRYLENAKEAMQECDAEAALNWIGLAEQIKGEDSITRSLKEQIQLFNESYWVLYLGSAYAMPTMFAKFDIDGNYYLVAYDNMTWPDGDTKNPYSYSNGVLSLLGTYYGWNEDENAFVEILMEKSWDGEVVYKGYILPDTSENYRVITSTQEYQQVPKLADQKISTINVVEASVEYFEPIISIAKIALGLSYEDLIKMYGEPISGWKEGGLGTYSYEIMGKCIQFECYDSLDGTTAVIANLYDYLDVTTLEESEFVSALGKYKENLFEDYFIYRIPTAECVVPKANAINKQCIISISGINPDGSFTAGSRITVYAI